MTVVWLTSLHTPRCSPLQYAEYVAHQVRAMEPEIMGHPGERRGHGATATKT